MDNAPQPRAISDLTLAATHTAASCALLFLDRMLLEWGHAELTDVGEFVMSELVWDAVRTTGVPEPNPRWTELENLALLRIRLVLLDEGIVVEVADRHNQPPKPSEQIRTACTRWSSYPTSVGRVVWCELGFQSQELTRQGLPRRKPSPVPRAEEPSQIVRDPEILGQVLDGLRNMP